MHSQKLIKKFLNKEMSNNIKKTKFKEKTFPKLKLRKKYLQRGMT